MAAWWWLHIPWFKRVPKCHVCSTWFSTYLKTIGFHALALAQGIWTTSSSPTSPSWWKADGWWPTGCCWRSSRTTFVAGTWAIWDGEAKDGRWKDGKIWDHIIILSYYDNMIQILSHYTIIWLVVWNMNGLWLSIQLGMSSSQLTKSMIFQRGRSTTFNHQPGKYH